VKDSKILQDGCILLHDYAGFCGDESTRLPEIFILSNRSRQDPNNFFAGDGIYTSLFSSSLIQYVFCKGALILSTMPIQRTICTGLHSAICRVPKCVNTNSGASRTYRSTRSISNRAINNFATPTRSTSYWSQSRKGSSPLQQLCTSSRRPFSVSTISAHNHLTPPKPGEEYVDTNLISFLINTTSGVHANSYSLDCI
jgi:hypothetical protein